MLEPTAIQNEEKGMGGKGAVEVELQVLNSVLQSSNLTTLATDNLKQDQNHSCSDQKWLKDLDNHLIPKGIK